jgi:Glyoxalase-like domain
VSTPFWVSAFLDLAPEEHAEGLALWQRLTGYDASAPRGDAREFVTLVPGDGDDFLRVQRLGHGASRIHLDVHVADPVATASDLTELGATINDDLHGYVAMSSPGGFRFCLVRHPAAARPTPTTWPQGHASYVDQVCLDIPPSRYDEEFDFWQRATDWERRDPKPGSEFGRLNPPPGQALQLLLQRLDDEEPGVRAHLDWSSTDRDAEVARHVAAGAQKVASFGAQEVAGFKGWTVMRGPAGMTYCITGRAPEVLG